MHVREERRATLGVGTAMLMLAAWQFSLLLVAGGVWLLLHEQGVDGPPVVVYVNGDRTPTVLQPTGSAIVPATAREGEALLTQLRAEQEALSNQRLRAAFADILREAARSGPAPTQDYEVPGPPGDASAHWANLTTPRRGAINPKAAGLSSPLDSLSQSGNLSVRVGAELEAAIARLREGLNVEALFAAGSTAPLSSVFDEVEARLSALRGNRGGSEQLQQLAVVLDQLAELGDRFGGRGVADDGGAVLAGLPLGEGELLTRPQRRALLLLAMMRAVDSGGVGE